VKRKGESQTEPFHNYIWHYEAHKYLKEKLRYFLLALSPYNADGLDKSLQRLAKEKNISGLRAYRVFGPHDLMIRAWMHDETFHNMEKWFYEYISIEDVRVEKVLSTYIREIEYRWYPDLNSQAESRLNADLKYERIARIESAQDKKLFKEYLDARLIRPKPSTPNGITFFICVRFPREITKPKILELTADIKEHISKHPRIFCCAEIDLAAGGLCDLMIRARAPEYFNIGKLIQSLSNHPNVSNTETYLSLEEFPVFGDTKLSLATYDALEPRHSDVENILPEFYPKRKWPSEPVANAVELYLLTHVLSRRNLIISEGLKKFLNGFLLGVLLGDETDEGRAEMGSACLRIFPPLEDYLRDLQGKYFKALSYTVEEIYSECFPFPSKDGQGKAGQAEHIQLEQGQSKLKGPEKASLAQLFHTYYKAISKKGKSVEIGTELDGFAEVRNQQFHLKRWKKDEWKNAADTVIRNWPVIQALISEIDTVCKGNTRRPPAIYD
jgi:hypothetical protein